MSRAREFLVDALHISVSDSRDEMGFRAGQHAAQAINRVILEKGCANVMFAAAPSQTETLRTLCETEVDWPKVNAFHMDEYIGLPETHPAGFRHFLKNAIFDRFQFLSVNLLNGNADNIPEEMARYSAILRSHPLDVCLLGIGENGHIAFNDPGAADFEDPKIVKTVSLDEKCRNQQVHDGCFARLDLVPKQALTVTIPSILQANTLICTVPAATKAAAVERLVHGPITTGCPATAMRRHRDAWLYLDQDSSARV